jgi:hypothetical protein
MPLPALRRRSLAALAIAIAAGGVAAQGRPMLVDAAARGDLARVEALLRTGADTELRDANGRTALLAARNADVMLADRDGVTPLAHARRRGHRAVEDILVRAGAR